MLVRRQDVKKNEEDDWQEILFAIHFTAMQCDVDEPLLNDAWGQAAPQEFAKYESKAHQGIAAQRNAADS